MTKSYFVIFQLNPKPGRSKLEIMGRSLVPLSFTFPPEMVSEIDQRADALGLSRSAYLRQLVRTDIESASREKGVKRDKDAREIAEMKKAIVELQERVGTLEKPLPKSSKKAVKSRQHDTGHLGNPERGELTVQGDGIEDTDF